KDQIPGTVKFIFQPAEEGTPDDEKGGAELMVAEGVMQDPAPEAVFGLHVGQQVAAGQVAYRAGGAMASSDEFRITVKGRQTHAAMPWAGIDPIVVASQIVIGLQTIVSRQIESIAAPAIITVGTFNGGVRNNIIPESVEMTGTIRSFLPKMQKEMHERVKRTAESIAASAGATAEVNILLGYPVTFNDPALAAKMHATLEGVFGADNVTESPMVTGAEDFSYFQQKAPGLFFFLGVRPADVPIEKAIPNHSPLFYADESALTGGVKALAHLAVDYMEQAK
ncbi:MAG: amidohydrolase, partial [Candidatus Hydrogenedentota bacterium]